jgi:hypothetical protein
LDFLAGLGISEGPGALRSGPMYLAKLSIVAAAVAVEEQKDSRVAKEAGKDGKDSEANKVKGNLRKSGVDCINSSSSQSQKRYEDYLVMKTLMVKRQLCFED